MRSSDPWQIPPEFQPDPRSLAYDLDRALSSIVSLYATIPDDAFTAVSLGTERLGQGVVIRDDGLVLTIGYLITEAEQIWLTAANGRAVAGHTMAYDYATGFGLVHALAPLGVPAMLMGNSTQLKPGTQVVVGGAGGPARSLAARVVARQEFAGYWEYLLEDAIFTAPAHPHWGGAPLIGPYGDLLGIGSLQLQHQAPGGDVLPLNMIVPIDPLKPILDDLLTLGRVAKPSRPWLGLYATEDVNDRVVVIGVAGDGPARRAGLRADDAVRAVGGKSVTSLAGFYRAIWALGDAGVDIPLTLDREGDVFDVRITSADRSQFLKSAPLH